LATLRDLVFDAAHPASLARFWAAALDGYRVAPYDDAEIARLAALGIEDVEDDPSVLVEPEDGVGPRYWFQRVPEGKRAKNRFHMDLVVGAADAGGSEAADDADAEAADAEAADAEVARLVGLGAVVVADHGELVTMKDPEGNEFCVLRQVD
jgi:hypothetical protein